MRYYSSSFVSFSGAPDSFAATGSSALLSSAGFAFAFRTCALTLNSASRLPCPRFALVFSTG